MASRTTARDWDALKSKVQECRITLPLAEGEKPVNYGKNTIDKNDILYALYDKHKYFVLGEMFDIYTGSDHSTRYRYKVIAITKNKKEIKLIQYFLHHDRQKHNWMPINPRGVYIKLF